MTLPGTNTVCVIPCYNAGARVRSVVEAALKVSPTVIIVDDGSTDDGVTRLDGLHAKIIRHPVNRGKGHAILTGIEVALQDDSVEYVVLLDADGQHDPAVMAEFVARQQDTNADLVIGARMFDGTQVPLRSRFGNAVTAVVTRLLLGANMPDTQCGYRLVTRRFAQEILERVSGGRYETEMEMIVMAVRGGHSIATVPIQTVYEPGNASSHFRKVSDSFLIYRRLLRAVLKYRGAR